MATKEKTHALGIAFGLAVAALFTGLLLYITVLF
jgi:hypothetical protein|tara:strand:+ start:2270 stop:2371 length:102 start_codon:yes stop_codon:yes gene_type:complete